MKSLAFKTYISITIMLTYLTGHYDNPEGISQCATTHQDPVEGRGCATALDVPQDGHTGVKAQATHDQLARGKGTERICMLVL